LHTTIVVFDLLLGTGAVGPQKNPGFPKNRSGYPAYVLRSLRLACLALMILILVSPSRLLLNVYAKNKLLGPQAFMKYVILSYPQRPMKISFFENEGRTGFDEP